MRNSRARRTVLALALIATFVFLSTNIHHNASVRSRMLNSLQQYALPALEAAEAIYKPAQVLMSPDDIIKTRRRKQLLDDFSKTEARWQGETRTPREIAEWYGIIRTPSPSCANGGAKLGWIPCTECHKTDGDHGIIPKKIFQTWKDSHLPESMCKAALTWSQVNPEYDYFYFDDNAVRRIIELEYGPNILKNFDCINVGAAKSDIWRLMVIYLFGGIYFDIDSAAKPEHPFRTWGFGNHTVVTGNESGGAAQWGLIYTPRHPIIRDAILGSLENLADRVPGYAPNLAFFELLSAFKSHEEFSIMPGWGKYMGGRVEMEGDVGDNALLKVKLEMVKDGEHWGSKPLDWELNC